MGANVLGGDGYVCTARHGRSRTALGAGRISVTNRAVGTAECTLYSRRGTVGRYYPEPVKVVRRVYITEFI